MKTKKQSETLCDSDQNSNQENFNKQNYFIQFQTSHNNGSLIGSSQQQTFFLQNFLKKQQKHKKLKLTKKRPSFLPQDGNAVIGSACCRRGPYNVATD